LQKKLIFDPTVSLFRHLHRLRLPCSRSLLSYKLTTGYYCGGNYYVQAAQKSKFLPNLH